MRIFILGLLAIATPATAADDSLANAQGNYNRCVREFAVRLEPSGDAPVDVARAAKAMCPAERFIALNAAVKAGGGNVEETERAADFFAAAEATIARLCRKTKDCIKTGGH